MNLKNVVVLHCLISHPDFRKEIRKKKFVMDPSINIGFAVINHRFYFFQYLKNTNKINKMRKRTRLMMRKEQL